MTLAQMLPALFAAAGSALCVFLALRAYRQTGEIISAWTLFLGLSLFDIYLPGALHYLGKPLTRPLWVNENIDVAVWRALLVFTPALLLFGLGHSLGGRANPQRENRTPSHNDIAVDRAWVVLALAGVIYGGSLLQDVQIAGGASLVERTVVGRFAGASNTAGTGDTAYATLVKKLLPVPLMAVGVLVSLKTRIPLPFRLTAILIGIGATLTTGFRGSVLSFFISLSVLNSLTGAARSPRSSATHPGPSRRSLPRGSALLLAGLVSFVVYGIARNQVNDDFWSGGHTLADAITTESNRVIEGAGLVGLTAILVHYPAQAPYFYGTTFVDMVLLPVPRSVYPTKPNWYGIDDITRGMGWPSSTQSAVTMPGELYANFGYPGILLMVVYGAFFGYCRGFRFHPTGRYLYAFSFVPMILPTFWMSFTGFMNQLVVVPFLWLSLALMAPLNRRRRHGHQSRGPTRGRTARSAP